MRIPDALPLMSSVVAPDAQQSVSLTHARPLRYPPFGLGSVTLGSTDHDVPSQCSMSPWSPTAPGKMGRKLGVCCAGPGVAHRPAVVGGEALHGRQLVVRLPGGRTRDDGPCRAVPLLDHVVEVAAHAVVGRVPDGHAAGRRRAAHALQDRPDHAGTGRGRTRHDRPGRCRSSSRSASRSGLLSPLSLRSAPTAQQSDPFTQEMSKNPPPSPAGSGGVAPSVQDVPFQVSTSGRRTTRGHRCSRW